MELPIDEEKYNLKWNSHHSIIANNVLEHLTGEELVDVTLSCEGKFIKAHKLILSASSQYFKNLFQLHQGQNPIIIMMNVRYEYIQYIIDYIYKGEVKLLSSEIEGILKLANDLQIKGLYGVLNKKFESLPDKNPKISTQNNGKTKDEKQIPESALNVSETVPTVSKNSVPNSIVLFGGESSANRNEENVQRQAVQIGKKKRNSEKCIMPKRRKVVKSPECKKEKPCLRPILPKPDINMDTAKPKDFRISIQVETRVPDPPNVCHQVLMTPKNVPNIISQSMANSTDKSDDHPPSVANSTESSRGSSPLLEVVIKEDMEKSSTADENHCTNSSNANVTKSVEETTKPVKQISAFMLFTREFRPILSFEHPDENIKQISLRLSKMWKDLPNVKKDSYYEAASKENERLKQNVLN